MSDFPRDHDQLDDELADRLLAGLAPVDTPAAYATVARVLGGVRAPATTAELAGEAAARAMFRTTRAGGATVTPISAAPSVRATRVSDITTAASARPSRSPRRTPRALAASLVAAAVLVLGGTAWAASKGALPGPVQDLAHDTLRVVGVQVPTSDGDPSDAPAGAGEHTHEGRGVSKETATPGAANRGTEGTADDPAHADGASSAATAGDPGAPTSGNTTPEGAPIGQAGAGADNPNAGGTPSRNPNAGTGNNNAGGNGTTNRSGTANPIRPANPIGPVNPAGPANPNSGPGNNNGGNNNGGNGKGNGSGTTNPNAGPGNNSGGNGNAQGG